LLDRLTNAIHDFQTAEAYSFTAEAGTYTSRFALVSRHNAATGLGNLTEQVSVQTTQDGIYVQGDALVQVYNAAGQMIFNQQTSGNIPLLPGVYMVVANGSTTKHVIQ
jgi:hypothetical protein